jgi:membrane protease YdiL (CAAX protease family)
MSTTSSPTSTEPSPAPSRPKATVALLAWLAIVAVQTAVVYAGRYAAEDPGSSDALYNYETAFGGGFIYLVLVGLTFLIARLLVDARAALALRSFAVRWVWAALGVVVAAAAATIVIQLVFDANASEEQGVLPDTWRPERAGAVAANAVVIVALGPFAEELFFRGLGVSVLRVLGTAGAILATGVAFGLVHGLVAGLVPLVLFGIGLAWVRVRARSVWPGVVAHALYNGAVLALGLYCTANPDLCLEPAFL